MKTTFIVIMAITAGTFVIPGFHMNIERAHEKRVYNECIFVQEMHDISIFIEKCHYKLSS